MTGIRRRSSMILLGLGVVAVLAFARPPATSAHPLGNFTINLYTRLVVAGDRLLIRHVMDMAEIPTFAERQQMDLNADGAISPDERAAYLAGRGAEILSGLSVRVGGDRVAPSVTASQLSFPVGQGGLPTMRLVHDLSLPIVIPADGGLGVTVTETGFADRVGWHEIVVQAGSGARVVSSSVPATDRSNELRAYPQDALTSPLDVRTAQVTVAAAGVGGVTQLGSSSGLARRGSDDPLASLLGGELSPGVVVLAVLLAAGLGAAHAVSPGHGKTLVAAYLVGSSGGRRHAATLGLTVAAAHTAGVFLLGAITLAAGALFVPERVIAWLSLVSGVLVIGLGAGLLVRAAGRRGIDAAGHVHGDTHAHGNTGPHGHPHPHRNLAPEAGRDSQLDHAAPLRRRNVIALGLAGGLVPSASALIVMLVAVSSGRLLFGLALIAAFGAGMALVLAGLAVATTFVRGALARHSGPSASPLARRAAAALPLASGLTVLVAGLVLTIGAAGRVG